jgi:hypothetical protein
MEGAVRSGASAADAALAGPVSPAGSTRRVVAA